MSDGHHPSMLSLLAYFHPTLSIVVRFSLSCNSEVFSFLPVMRIRYLSSMVLFAGLLQFHRQSGILTTWEYRRYPIEHSPMFGKYPPVPMPESPFIFMTAWILSDSFAALASRLKLQHSKASSAGKHRRLRPTVMGFLLLGRRARIGNSRLSSRHRMSPFLTGSRFRFWLPSVSDAICCMYPGLPVFLSCINHIRCRRRFFFKAEEARFLSSNWLSDKYRFLLRDYPREVVAGFFEEALHHQHWITVAGLGRFCLRGTSLLGES